MTEATIKSTPRKARRQTRKSAPLATEQGTPAANKPAETKIGKVIRVLRQHGGASLNELVAATGWQPHTTRAALTGLRKKGHSITKGQVDGVTRYTIASAPGA